MASQTLWIVGALAVGLYVVSNVPVSEISSVSLSFDALAQAIQQEEGYYPGSRAYRNNNPGNLRYVGQAGAAGADSQGFAVFSSYQSGYDALVAQLKLDASRHPDWSIWDFVNSYAPSSENDVNSYVSNISSILGIDPESTTLGAFS